MGIHAPRTLPEILATSGAPIHRGVAALTGRDVPQRLCCQSGRMALQGGGVQWILLILNRLRRVPATIRITTLCDVLCRLPCATRIILLCMNLPLPKSCLILYECPSPYMGEVGGKPEIASPSPTFQVSRHRLSGGKKKLLKINGWFVPV